MPSAWLIRSKLARTFEDNGVVAVAWPDLIGDLRRMSRWEIVEALERAHVSAPDQDADELLAFRDLVVGGDLVITPDTANRELLVGRVVGPYEYRRDSPIVDEDDGAFCHLRTMEWWGRGDRSALTPNLSKDLNVRRPIRQLSMRTEWQRIAEEIRDAPPKPPRPPAGTRRPASRSPRTSAPRPTRREPAADPLCPRCLMRKPKSQFVPGSEVCADCRADE